MTRRVDDRGIRRSPKALKNERRFVLMIALVLAFVVLLGPLAVLYGADSRLDDRRNGWPKTHR